MAEMVRITCVSPSSVSIDDIGVRLRGQGASADVLRATADSSRDLVAARSRRLVSVRNVPVEARRPLSDAQSKMFWPFTPLASVHERVTLAAPPPVAAAADPEVVAVLRRIDGKLGELLSRPSAAPPEVVAAHVRAVSALAQAPAGLPGGGNLPGPGATSEPQFIPSRIMPESAETDIRVKEGVVEKDVGGATDALKKLKGRKT